MTVNSPRPARAWVGASAATPDGADEGGQQNPDFILSWGCLRRPLPLFVSVPPPMYPPPPPLPQFIHPHLFLFPRAISFLETCARRTLGAGVNHVLCMDNMYWRAAGSESRAGKGGSKINNSSQEMDTLTGSSLVVKGTTKGSCGEGVGGEIRVSYITRRNSGLELRCRHDASPLAALTHRPLRHAWFPGLKMPRARGFDVFSWPCVSLDAAAPVQDSRDSPLTAAVAVNILVLGNQFVLCPMLRMPAGRAHV